MKQLLIASILAVFLPIYAFSYISPGVPTGHINDYANILELETENLLNSSLENFKNTTGNEVVVLTINSLGGDFIEDYAAELFKEWGIGNKEKDTGVLLLISKEDKEMRIEVGYGLEPVLTDIETANIIREILIPAFQSNDFDGGVTSAIQKITEDISNGGDVVPLNNSSRPAFNFGKILTNSFYPFLFLVMMLGSILGRSKSWWAGGLIGAVGGILIAIFSGIVAGIIGVLILVPLGLIFDYIVSKKSGGGMGGPFIFGGGGSNGGFGSGGGFGGFGGGMSGGGGSSGKW